VSISRRSWWLININTNRRLVQFLFCTSGHYCEEATVIPGECPEGSYMPYGVTPASSTSDPYTPVYVGPGKWWLFVNAMDNDPCHLLYLYQMSLIVVYIRCSQSVLYLKLIKLFNVLIYTASSSSSNFIWNIFCYNIFILHTII